MRIVFLDFDGPIIPQQSHETRRPLDKKAWPDSVAALNRITDSTGAKIVVSSTWRKGGLSEVRRLLKSWGVTGTVVGVTPVLFEKVGNVWTSAPRGKEIAEYLKRKKNMESFVILDDDNDMDELEPYLIQTPFETGLTDADADLAIDMLATRSTVRLA